jgi:hypothetical protein
MTGALLLLSGPALRSPDGVEMLRLAGQWLGRDEVMAAPHFWPKLWPALNLPAVALGHGIDGARLLNLVLWGLVAYPLHLLASLLGGVSAGRRAVLLYLLLPLIWPFATVLDARPLGALITTGFVAAAVMVAKRNRGWGWMLALAAVAPLARPEGVLLPFMAGFACWCAGKRVMRSALMGGLCLIPHMFFNGPNRGISDHESLYASWYGTWAVSDMLVVFGPSSVPTRFRDFAIAAMDSQVVSATPSKEEVLSLCLSMPMGLMVASSIVLSGIGFVGIAMLVHGLVRVLPRKRRWWIVTAAFAPWIAIAVAPMARGQAGPLSNYLFLFPSLLAVLAVGMVPSRPIPLVWPVLFATLLGVEVHNSPLRAPPPYFLESSEAADIAHAMLVRNPPSQGVVATDFSGRNVVLGAGLELVELEPIWFGPVPDGVSAVLLSSVGAQGEDGGWALELLDDPSWRLEWVAGDGDIAASHGVPTQALRTDQGWYALVVRR